MLINILGNAIKFTNEGSVKLNVTESVSDIIFSVTDTGMRMKNEDLEAIFDSFKQFIEMQGGNIWAESELGKGSHLHFYPAQEEDA